MKLPYGHAANREQIGQKVETYSLNFNHDKGKHKARIFRAKLGITLENREVLIAALVEAVVTTEAKFRKSDDFGDQYAVD